MKEKCLNVRMFGMFDWRKGAMCLMSVAVALCAFTGRASDPLFPYFPFDPDFPIPPIGPVDDPDRDNTEPIIFVCSRFFASENANLLETYNDRITADPADYEAYICRAFARIATLWQENDVKSFAIGCGLDFDPETGMMKRRATLATTIMNEVQENDKMDEICKIAVPVFADAIDDLNQLPKDWPGYMKVSKEDGYEVDETIYLDYADAQLLKAVFCEVISFMNLVRGYRDPVTGLPGGINPEALEEARTWWAAAVMQLSAFNVAQYNRTDYEKVHFFELSGSAFLLIDENVQNLLDLPYWTARVDLMGFEEFAFQRKGESNVERRIFLHGKKIDISLRSLFEGKVSQSAGTFPAFNADSPDLATLPDSTLGGTFPGMSRTKLGEYADLFGFVYPFDASDEVKEYSVLYKLPPGAENNPENPATFATDLQSEIPLLPPTFEGHAFTGWTNDGVIPPETAKALTFEATFAPLTSEESLYEMGMGSDGKAYTSEVKNDSVKNVENPVRVKSIEGLLGLATSRNTDVKLGFTANDAANIDPGVAEAISSELEKVSAGGFDSVAFVDLSILFNGALQMNCELGTVIKLHIPWQVKTGGSYAVVRMHNEKAQVIPQGEANKTEDGEYFEVDVEKGELVLCIGKFSDYAIAETSSVKVGENASAAVEDGVCTISGEGSVTNFPSGFDRNSFTNAVVEGGITGIGARFFKKCRKLNTVTLGNDVVSIGTNAFYLCTALEKIEILNPEFDVSCLDGAIVYQTAIRPDGSLYPIPDVTISGYAQFLYGKEELTDSEWINLGKVVPGKPMEDYLPPCRFFRIVLTKIEE